MPAASEIEPVCPGIFLWRLYDPSVKADLFSTALETAAGTYLIDPVRLTPAAGGSLASLARIAGIVVTNENHERAAAQFSEKFQISVHLHAALLGTTGLPKMAALQDGCIFSPGLTAVEIEGGPAGEIAVHFDASGGTMILGDALINFEPYGFALLPAKYCSNFKAMRLSLSKLLDYSFDRMLFAHGTPILSRARQRLEELLKEHR
jgi:hypothetical protein